jgi:hypothetical protein
VIIAATRGSRRRFFPPLIDHGQTGGVHVIQCIEDVNDHDTVEAQGLDDKQTTYATGWWLAHVTGATDVSCPARSAH